MKTLLFYLKLPGRLRRLKKLIGHLQPVGKIGEIQQIFDIKYKLIEK